MNQIQINLSKEQGETWYYLNDDDKAEDIFFGGAAGPGKTWLGCLWQIYRRIKYPNTRGLIGRNVLKDLKDTTLMTFFEVAKEVFDLTPHEYRYYEQKGRIEFFNGSVIFIKELKMQPRDPNFTDLGSLEITDFFIDEITEITRKAHEILTSRVRYNLIDGVKKGLGAGNPENNWVKNRYVSDQYDRPVDLGPKTRVVLANLESNPDKEFVKVYRENLQDLNPYDRARLLYGDWTVRMNESPFFPSHSRKNVVDGLVIDYDYPVWLSFDFNVDPTTVLVAQVIPGQEVRVIMEIQKKGGTEVLCDELLESIDYPPMGFYVTGDHSGHSGSTSAGMLPHGVYNTDFEIIKRKLSIGDGSLRRTRTANARHVHSYKLCDSFFRHIPYKIDGNCKVLLTDLDIAQRTEKGTLRKDRDNFKMDAGDAFRYLVSGIFKGSHDRIARMASQIKAEKELQEYREAT